MPARGFEMTRYLKTQGARSRRAHHMSEHQRDTAFLTRIISYDDTPERRDLAEKISRVQRDELCVRRAAWLMALFASLATAGVCYAAVFLMYPMDVTQFMSQFVI